MAGSREFCKQAPPVYESFLKVVFDHAVGDQILGPTKNPCPSFFSSPAMGDVWNVLNWGNYPKTNNVVTIPLKAADRLVAIGDFHGDLTKTRQALELAKLLGKDDKWSGGETVLVQVGDIFDRGNHEIKILYLLEKLKRDAYRQGGAVHVLHGNHETLNMLGDFRYTRKDAFKEFSHWARWFKIHNHMRLMVDGCSPPIEYGRGLPKLDEVPSLEGVDFDSKIGRGIKGRLLALRPGGSMATEFLSKFPAVLVVGKSMFVHGGIRQADTTGGYKTLNAYNKQVSEWAKGKTGLEPPNIIKVTRGGVPGITWDRELGTENREDPNIPCADLSITLSRLQLKRLLVGHTLQVKRLINSACNERVIRLDVGMSSGCLNNPPQALEILDDTDCFVLTSRGRIPLSVADKLPPREEHGPDDEDIAYAERKRYENNKSRRANRRKGAPSSSSQEEEMEDAEDTTDSSESKKRKGLMESLREIDEDDDKKEEGPPADAKSKRKGKEKKHKKRQGSPD